MEADATPKIDLVVDDKPVGQLGLAHCHPTEVAQDTDYSDTDDEETSEGAAMGNPDSAKRSSARIRLMDQEAGQFHKRARLT